MNLRRQFFATSFILVGSVLSLSAQPGNPGGNPVPITGIEYLIGMGGLFGARKIFKSMNKRPQQ